jgi:hypothetical protein
MESLLTTHVIMTLSLTIDSGGTLQITPVIMTLNFTIDSDKSVQITLDIMTLSKAIDSARIIKNNILNDTQHNNRYSKNQHKQHSA